MSDISAVDGGSVSEEAAPVEDFDLDAAVEEFANSAPDEWKGKAGKIQSELKGLRERFAPYRDSFDGVADSDKDAIFALVNGLKTGDTEGVTNWMLQAAKGLAGDKFGDLVAGLTPAEVAEIVEEAAEETPGTPDLSPEGIQKMVQDAINADRTSQAEAKANADRQTAINTTFAELGLNTDRDANGRLTDFTTQQVAMLAINDHKGDIAAAHEAYNKWLGDAAKAYLQKHQGDSTLAPEGGSGVGEADPALAEMTPKQKATARIKRLMDGPSA